MEGSERERLRTLLKEQSLMFGDFTLASGKKSNFYFDSKRTTLLPEGAWLAAREILRVIRERGIEADAIGGLTLGADPIVCPVAALSHAEGPPLRAFIVRKGTKEHGTGRKIEGQLEPGSRVIIVDDVVTTAGSTEGQVVRVSDTIAYVNHDLHDALRAEVIKRSDIPKQVLQVLGDSHSKRIDTMVKDLIYCSQDKDLEKLHIADDISSAIYTLRDFLYERVYESDKLSKEFRKAKKVLQDLYTYYIDHVDEIFAAIPKEKKPDKHRVVCDFIAGMTDRFALTTYERLFLPQQWTVL